MQTTIDRRNLIKGAGLAGLATAAGMLAGSVAHAEESASADERDWTYEADLVIVGSGSAAYCAAIEAAEAGASVLVLREERPVPSAATPSSAAVP